MTPNRFITALEHQPIPITAGGIGWSLTPAEAERLAHIGEQRPGFCEVGHRKVKVAQFCGVVGLGDRILEILPKTQDAGSTVEECRGVLLRLLGWTERFPHFKHQPVGQQLRRAPLLEAFISAFFDAVITVLRGGLLKQYQEHEDDLRVVRGRISLERQLGSHSNRPDVVACAFDELAVDNVWNRILKKAIRCTRPWIRSVELNRKWVELMGMLDSVEDARLSSTDVARLAFNRQAERYRAAIDWARWILALLAPALRAGRSEAPALLFDMNKLFESAVAKLVRTRMHGLADVTVDVQDTSRNLVTMVDRERVEPGFILRPDLVFRHHGSVVGIADTKWKLLAQDSRGRLIPNQVDMYQMHAYAAAFQCTDVRLIYPWRNEFVGRPETEFRLPAAEGRVATVRVICIDVHADELPTRLGQWPLFERDQTARAAR